MKRGSGKQSVEGKGFRLADEVRYIQNKAAEHDGRVVTLGPFPPIPEMLGCWTSPINWPPPGPGWRSGADSPRGDRHQLCHRMEGALSH
jgi:hypothetical protein